MSHPSVDDSIEIGRSARRTTPRSSHADWTPSPNRRDPVTLLEEQNASRVPWLVPIRHARMSVSPFTFFRGAARIMAADLAATPVSGIEVQLGGDAHLSNFGAYASPERRLVFDQNDFDETLAGPWEWDLKRLAASFVVASQFHGLPAVATRSIAAEVVRAYRTSMGRFAGQGFLSLWYDYVDVDDIGADSGMSAKEMDKRLDRFRKKATRKTSQQALEKLAEVVDGRWRIRHEPPVLFPLERLPGDEDQEQLRAAVDRSLASYATTLDDNRAALLDRYELVDVGVKVVGVGSVGTRCLVALLRGRDNSDPLFLQIKEAGPSVLAEYLAPSPYEHQGRRVVEGQRLVQATSDIFLGWTTGDLAGVHYYVRQLRDWKGSVDVEAEGVTAEQLTFYADLCGMTLARGHARSGDAVAIHSYAGKSATLDEAIVTFAENYAALNLEDYHRFTRAIADGRLECAEQV
ncbi:MAG: DUF2252 domain-containing protein [Acidimicrobiales bacterium]|jgi:uncharacterized protein (DUF2252 family)|nr:DUF2252 domain-containing protein [Acidimicrobiales bacterium]